MASELRAPSRRACERCGRVERWDETEEIWTVEEEGAVHCIHEWDIDGEFVPVET